MPASRDSAPRQRATISCDWCKQKRSRCIRPRPDTPCTNCTANGVVCESKLRRKQRVYGSVESLSQRYRALDALVAGLFPGEDTKSLDGLYALADARGIHLSAKEDLSAADGLFAQKQTPNHSQQSRSQLSKSLLNETLVPTPSGIGHYVGPSSSFRFINAIRKLVRDHNNLHGQTALRDDFSTLRGSIVLERGNGDHPAPPFSPPSPRPDDSDLDAIFRFPPLPPPALADSMVTAFFENLHRVYPLFLRPVFQLQYEAFSADPFSTGTELGWRCCLAMIFVFGAQIIDGDESLTEQFVAFVRSSLGQIVGSASLVSVQALLLLQLYEHNSGQRNASWIFLGCASRMAIALGLHLDSANRSCRDVNERVTRTKVWWTLYSFERTLCLMLGRPSSIDDADITVAMPDAGSDNGDMPLRYIEFEMRLSKIQGDIRQSTYHPPESREAPTMSPLLSDLELWSRELPPHLRPSWRSMTLHHRRANLMLHLHHQHLVLVLSRPFLLYRCQAPRVGKTSESLVDSMAATCLESAQQILQHCNQLAEEDLLDPLGWLDVYYIYLAVLVLSLGYLNTPSEDHSARQLAISAIFHQLRRRRLAPTFRHLILIARQFALISGALIESTELEPPMIALTDALPTAPTQSDNMFADWLMESLGHTTFDMGAYGMPGSDNVGQMQSATDLQGLFGPVMDGNQDSSFHRSLES